MKKLLICLLCILFSCAHTLYGSEYKYAHDLYQVLYGMDKFEFPLRKSWSPELCEAVEQFESLYDSVEEIAQRKTLNDNEKVEAMQKYCDTILMPHINDILLPLVEKERTRRCSKVGAKQTDTEQIACEQAGDELARFQAIKKLVLLNHASFRAWKEDVIARNNRRELCKQEKERLNNVLERMQKNSVGIVTEK